MLKRTDDPTVSDDEPLYRRVWDKPNAIKVLPDGTFRPTSAVFTDNTDAQEVSVFVSSLTTSDKVLENFPNHGLVTIKASVPRAEHQIVAKTPEDSNIAHRVICPDEGFEHTRKSAAKVMARNAAWVLLPASKR